MARESPSDDPIDSGWTLKTNARKEDEGQLSQPSQTSLIGISLFRGKTLQTKTSCHVVDDVSVVLPFTFEYQS